LDTKENRLNPEILDSFYSDISLYKYDQYLNYPSANEKSWEDFLKYRLETSLESEEVTLFGDFYKGYAVLLLVKISKWDKEHFGFKVANVSVLAPFLDEDYKIVLQGLLRKLFTFLESENVKFVSVRINGDDINSIHCFEESGFKYFEDVIWPVHKCVSSDESKDIYTRLMVQTDLEQVIQIASKYQYQRGHFHCDKGFDLNKVNSLYGKWVETAFRNGDPIVVAEYENKVVGYFVLKMDKELSNYSGYSYGRMKSLAIDSTIRGKGIGRTLFEGSIRKLKEIGAAYIDSGYSTKNHISARLHTNCDFYSVYEEVTFHKWL
jgi:L-amino acid N-acyltransferase YncA